MSKCNGISSTIEKNAVNPECQFSRLWLYPHLKRGSIWKYQFCILFTFSFCVVLLTKSKEMSSDQELIKLNTTSNPYSQKEEKHTHLNWSNHDRYTKQTESTVFFLKTGVFSATLLKTATASIPTNKQNKTYSIMVSCHSGDNIVKDHTHMVIITCNIEKPKQTYRLGTVSNRLMRVCGVGA